MEHHKQEQDGVYQLGLDAGVFPYPLERFGIDRGIIRILQTDKKWMSLEGNHAAIVNVEKNIAPVIHSHKLSVERIVLNTSLSLEKNLDGIVLLLPPVTDPEAARSSAAAYYKPLAHGGMLFVIESKGRYIPNTNRVQILRHAGFVYPEVNEHDQYIFWYARKEKQTKRKPANARESEKTGPVIRTILKQVQEQYGQAGFVEVIATSPIVDLLSVSTYIPRDITLLREGRGVIIQSPCGCMVEHSVQDEWNIVGPVSCDGNHVGLDKAISTFEQLTAKRDKEIRFRTPVQIQYESPPSERTIGSHGGCGGQIYESAFELRRTHRRNKPFIRYQIDTHCTSCGDVFPAKTRVVDVPV